MRVLREILKANKDRKIIIMPVGISGSGKTTLYKNLSKEFDIEHISFDKIRIEKFLENNPDKKENIYREAYKYINENKIKLLPIAKKKMKETNKNIVYIDNTNLKKKARHKFLCETPDWLKIGVFFKPVLNLAIKRQKNKDRDKYVSPKVIEEQFKILEEPSLEEFDILIKKNINENDYIK